MKPTLITILTALTCSALGAELRADLPDLFRQHYILRSDGGEDFSLDYEPGSAVYTLNSIFDADFVLRMTEELTVFDTEPHPEIEMCNGTVVRVNSADGGCDETRVGVTFGTIDKRTKVFEGQFVLGDHTYFVESADKFYNESQLEDGRIVSVVYMDTFVVQRENATFDRLEVVPQTENDDFAYEMSQRNAGNNICNVEVLIDNGVYNDAGRDMNKIRNRVYQQMMTLNRIYGSTFKTGDVPTVKFTIARILTATNKFCETRRSNIYCGVKPYTTKESSKFLSDFSRQDARDFCLSYVFTNRYFGGTLGVAYVGGVCNSGEKRSFNTGFVSLSKRTAQYNTDFTFVHEIGHNFGSNHDSRAPCLGSRSRGAFMMGPFLSAVQKPNNNKFSSCSQRDIRNELDRIFSGKKKNCFAQSRQRLIEE